MSHHTIKETRYQARRRGECGEWDPVGVRIGSGLPWVSMISFQSADIS